MKLQSRIRCPSWDGWSPWETPPNLDDVDAGIRKVLQKASPLAKILLDPGDGTKVQYRLKPTSV